MFTEDGQRIVDGVKDIAFTLNAQELDVAHLLGALVRDRIALGLLAEATGLARESLLRRVAVPEAPRRCAGSLAVSAKLRPVLVEAQELAEAHPDPRGAGLVDLVHLACAAGLSAEARGILGAGAVERGAVEGLLARWIRREARAPKLDDLTARFVALRGLLQQRLFGQEEAIHSFVEGLFSAELVAGGDAQRRAPRALFVLAGPPGVGKTFLAELAAEHLKRPFKRFDMSAYAGNLQAEQLVGLDRSVHASRPGALTGFVAEHPDAVLIFDEIERAHPNAILYFLQLLDAGQLEDKFLQRNVAFGETIVIFTTNAGRRLYDQPNATGLRSAGGFHRRTILDALEQERHPLTGEPYFPPSICSRFATGCPVLFNRLGVNELERVARAELERVGALFERQYGKRVTFEEEVPIALILREGGHGDARTLRAQAGAFLKGEIMRFCQLFKAGNLDAALEQADEIGIGLEGGLRQVPDEVRRLFQPARKARILACAPPGVVESLRRIVPQAEWLAAHDHASAAQALVREDADFAVLDLWLGQETAATSQTVRHFDHTPLGANSLGEGQRILKTLRQRFPGIPVYLVSRDAQGATGPGAIDDELFAACMRAGGARGVLALDCLDEQLEGAPERRARFAAALDGIARQLYRERKAFELAREGAVLRFDSVPAVDKARRRIAIRLRNFSIGRAVSALDVGGLLDEVERPQTRFADVVGAERVKQELGFLLECLKGAGKLRGLGAKPPAGLLLHGPPGTGKTMLARALAGESRAAFLPVVASQFVTMWQGSGAQNVRELFARARRYAPAIVFIDEIDLIGAPRGAAPGIGHGEEVALNALLSEMDGFAGQPPDRPVFVLGATNTDLQGGRAGGAGRGLDPALLRRFSRLLYVGLPDTAARAEFLRKRLAELGGAQLHGAAERLAELSPGLSFADLENALLAALRAALATDQGLSEDGLVAALDELLLGEERPWSKELLESTACHEAGHALMYWLSGHLPPEVSIIARGRMGGGMRLDGDEAGRESLTRAQLLERIRTLLGGRAAETLCYGPEEGLTTGAGNDLARATDLANRLVCGFGMDEGFGLAAYPGLLERPAEGPLALAVHEKVKRLLDDQMRLTLEALRTRRAELDAVKAALLEKNRLTRDELRRLLEGEPPAEAHDGVTHTWRPGELKRDGGGGA
ncbi:MAG: AAA family ATPase [Planctomycetota bacterium]|nr:AAA family ATPase [Planctomycetota bacterium]